MNATGSKQSVAWKRLGAPCFRPGTMLRWPTRLILLAVMLKTQIYEDGDVVVLKIPDGHLLHAGKPQGTQTRLYRVRHSFDSSQGRGNVERLDPNASGQPSPLVGEGLQDHGNQPLHCAQHQSLLDLIRREYRRAYRQAQRAVLAVTG